MPLKQTILKSDKKYLAKKSIAKIFGLKILALILITLYNRLDKINEETYL